MAQAKNGDKVQVHYTGTLDNGTIFDSSGGSGQVIFSPIEFVIGQENDYFPKFQEAVIGLEQGQSITVKIASEDAYGPHLKELVFEAPLSELAPNEVLFDGYKYPNGKRAHDIDIKKGDVMEVTLEQGGELVPVIITDVNSTTVTFDANHPLTGKDLTFDISLVNIM